MKNWNETEYNNGNKKNRYVDIFNAKMTTFKSLMIYRTIYYWNGLKPNKNIYR